MTIIMPRVKKISKNLRARSEINKRDGCIKFLDDTQSYITQTYGVLPFNRFASGQTPQV